MKKTFEFLLVVAFIIGIVNSAYALVGVDALMDFNWSSSGDTIPFESVGGTTGYSKFIQYYMHYYPDYSYNMETYGTPQKPYDVDYNTGVGPVVTASSASVETGSTTWGEGQLSTGWYDHTYGSGHVHSTCTVQWVPSPYMMEYGHSSTSLYNQIISFIPVPGEVYQLDFDVALTSSIAYTNTGQTNSNGYVEFGVSPWAIAWQDRKQTSNWNNSISWNPTQSGSWSLLINPLDPNNSFGFNENWDPEYFRVGLGFYAIAKGYEEGVPGSSPEVIPEPSTLLLLGFGLLPFFKRKQS